MTISGPVVSSFQPKVLYISDLYYMFYVAHHLVLRTRMC
jgi:hypothetical protein